MMKRVDDWPSAKPDPRDVRKFVGAEGEVSSYSDSESRHLIAMAANIAGHVGNADPLSDADIDAIHDTLFPPISGAVRHERGNVRAFARAVIFAANARKADG